HEDVYETVKNKLVSAYNQLRIGDPLDEKNHVGPLIDKDAVKMYQAAIETCKSQGGKLLVDGEVLEENGFESGCYVKRVIAEVKPEDPIVKTETSVPILYIMKYKTMDEAIAIQNSV